MDIEISCTKTGAMVRINNVPSTDQAEACRLVAAKKGLRFIESVDEQYFGLNEERWCAAYGGQPLSIRDELEADVAEVEEGTLYEAHGLYELQEACEAVEYES